MTLARILCLLVAAAALAHAELPPTVYADMQEKAPEALTVQVDKVVTTPLAKGSEGSVTVTATATVKSVERTATGLKVGDTITIRYEYRPLPRGMVGPSPTPVLKEGETTPAWLERAEGGTDYAPAARGYSFRSLTPPAEENPS